MNIAGEYVLYCSRQAAWQTLNDPQVLARCTPGCQSLNVLEPDSYEMVTKIGIASISGTYKGRMRLCDKEGEEKYSMIAEGTGPIGTINISGAITLKEAGATTSVNYSFEARVGGSMTGLAQRALLPIAKVLTKQFFKSIARELNGGGVDAEPA